MTKEERSEIVEKAFRRSGAAKLLTRAWLEYSELIVTLQHLVAGCATAEEVIENLAEAEILNRQMKLLFGKDKIRAAMDRKLKRLAEGLKGVA